MDNRTKTKKKKLYVFIILERIYVGKADLISYEKVIEYLLQIIGASIGTLYLDKK